MKRILTLLDQQWVTETDFDKLPDEIKVSELEAQIFTMTKIVGLVRMLPEEIFSNIETKQNMLSAAAGACDNLIEMENEDEVSNSIESDEGYGLLTDISIPGVIDHGKVAPKESDIPALGAQPRDSSNKE